MNGNDGTYSQAPGNGGAAPASGGAGGNGNNFSAGGSGFVPGGGGSGGSGYWADYGGGAGSSGKIVIRYMQPIASVERINGGSSVASTNEYSSTALKVMQIFLTLTQFI